MSKPRPWPNVAMEARDRAAETAVKGRRALMPMFDNQMTQGESLRRIAIAADCFQTILRLLEGQGAQTRP